MTVCIAAIAQDKTIITASDLMVSGAVVSADSTAIKVEPFHKHWAAMIATDDLTQCIPIIDGARELFRGKENTLRTVRTCFKRAYQQYLSEYAADQVLGRFGLSMEAFVKGKHKLAPDQVNSLSTEIRQIKGKSDFLIYGHDENKMPHIVVVKDPGLDEVHDKPGFCAIGSGWAAADGMLFYLRQSVGRSMEETIFNVCAAKFMAEKVGTVGEDTFLFVKKYGYQAYASIDMNLVNTIRGYWDKDGKPKVPNGVLESIKTAHIRFMAEDLDEAQ